MFTSRFVGVARTEITAIQWLPLSSSAHKWTFFSNLVVDGDIDECRRH